MRDNVFTMNIKSILSIAAFSTAFIFSTFLAGFFIGKTEYQPDSVVPPVAVVNSNPTSCFKNRKPSATAEKISNILRQDDRNGRERSGRLYSLDNSYNAPFAERAETVAAYADASGSMKSAGLPTEFQTAWRAHMKAWRDYADFLVKMKSASVRENLDEESFNDFEREYNADINTTWIEVLRVADDYGVDVSGY